MSDRSHDIVLVGAGKLAIHLGMALHRRGLNVLQVCNRTPEKGRKLALRLNASWCDDLRGIHSGADLYLLAVSDTALPEVAKNFRCGEKLVVHTSGSMEMDVLAPVSSNIGVLYPIQTFTDGSRIDFSRVPVCIEANTESNVIRLKELAERISGTVSCLGSEQRRWLHLGAVFASNFTNHLNGVAKDILLEHGVPPHLLRPIIRQTAGNFGRGNPFRLQTGPAVRNEERVMAIHRALLAGRPEYLRLYDLITDSIIKQHPLHDKL